MDARTQAEKAWLHALAQAIRSQLFVLLPCAGPGKVWSGNEASFSARHALGSPLVGWLATLAMFKRAGLTLRLHEGLAAHTPSTGKA